MVAYEKWMTILLWCWIPLTDCVGPRLKTPVEGRTSPRDEVSYQNVAILEELRTITDLILRSQQKAEGVETMVMPVVHDCTTLRDAGIRANGVYSVFPFTFKVYCDMTTAGGGWTVIQRRAPIDVHENFNRPWGDYRTGFGDLYQEFWLGLEPLHQLTYSGPYELRIDMVDYEFGPKYAHYNMVSVGPESDGYRLRVSNYLGNAGDALSMFHSGRRFSTLDRDQDVSRNKSCAQEKEAGWWFHACYAAHLNGIYPVKPKRESSSSNIRWWSTREHVLVLTAVEMKIRRRTTDKQVADAPDVKHKTSDNDETRTNNTSTFDKDSTDQNGKNGSVDYDYMWKDGEDTIIFADIEVGDTDEYNITEHYGRSDVSPWEISNRHGNN